MFTNIKECPQPNSRGENLHLKLHNSKNNRKKEEERRRKRIKTNSIQSMCLGTEYTEAGFRENYM
jgi:hypothetical protein